MLNKTLKILLGIYSFSLFCILLLPHSMDDGGFFAIWIIELLAFAISVIIIKDIKKSRDSKILRILNIILVSMVLYSVIMLVYGLSNFGHGEDGIGFFLTLIICFFFLGLSIIVGIISVVLKKNQFNEDVSSIRQFNKNNPNKILSVILIMVLFFLFYGVMVSGMARLFNNPEICLMHIGIREKALVFNEMDQDRCISKIARTVLNVDHCEQIKDIRIQNNCMFSIALKKNDINICHQIEGNVPDHKPTDKDYCYYSVALYGGENNPKYCDYIEDEERKNRCYSKLA